MATKHERGFTLIEALVAVTLLSLVVLGIAPLFVAGAKANASGFDYTTVSDLARDKLEHLMNEPIGSADLLVPVGQTQASYPNDLPAHVDPVTGAASTKPTDPVYPYRRTWLVELFRINPDNSLQAVTSGSNPAVSSYQVKRITVTVLSTRTDLPGARRVTVGGMLKNPDPVADLQ